MRHDSPLYYKEGIRYFIYKDINDVELVGTWLPFGSGDTTVNIAGQCNYHGPKCKRSFSSNKFENAEGCLVDWLAAGAGKNIVDHKSVPKPPAKGNK